MDKRKIVWTMFAVIAVGVAISGIADNVAETHAERALKRALVTFAAARTLNGIISVAQSTEVGVGVTVAIGQILDPINDLIEQFSTVMLVAASSLGLQNVLLNMTASWGVTAALIVAAAFSIAVLWSERLAQIKFAASASRLLLIMLCIRFIIPMSVIGTNLIADTFLAAEQADATAELEGTTKEIERIREEVEPPPVADQSLMDRLSSVIDESLESYGRK